MESEVIFNFREKKEYSEMTNFVGVCIPKWARLSYSIWVENLIFLGPANTIF